MELLLPSWVVKERTLTDEEDKTWTLFLSWQKVKAGRKWSLLEGTDYSRKTKTRAWGYRVKDGVTGILKVRWELMRPGVFGGLLLFMLVLQLQSCIASEWPAPTPFLSQTLSFSVCDSAKWVRDLPRTWMWYWRTCLLYPHHLLHLFWPQEAILLWLVTSKVLLPFNRRNPTWATLWSTRKILEEKSLFSKARLWDMVTWEILFFPLSWYFYVASIIND